MTNKIKNKLKDIDRSKSLELKELDRVRLDK